MKKNEIWYPAEIVPRKSENKNDCLYLELMNSGKGNEHFEISKLSNHSPIELYILDFDDEILAEPSEIKWIMNKSKELEILSLEKINEIFKKYKGWIHILVEYDEENDLEIPVLKEGFVIIKTFKK